jgi:hypothetical protein
VAVLRDEDVCRLNVAMNNSLCVRSVEGIRNLDSEEEQRVDVHWPVADQVLQSLAVKELHSNEGLAIFFANVMNRADVGMIQRRGRLRLALKAGQRLRVSGDFIRQELQRHETMQPSVLSLVHHTHPAPAQFLADAVVRDGLADQKRETPSLGPQS